MKAHLTLWHAAAIFFSLTSRAMSNTPSFPKNDFKGTSQKPGAIAAFSWGEAPDEYIVQPGDTMHDICREIVNADFYWPKLWSQNPDVKNPHVIYPGRKLRFFPGEDSEPFFVEVKEDVDIVPVENNVAENTFTNEQIPPKINLGEQVQVDRFSVEVLTNADLDKLPVPPDYLETSGFAQVPATVAVQLPGRLSKEEIEPKGKVLLGVQDERLLTASTHYILETEEDLPVGKVVSVFRDYENLNGDEVEGESKLYQYIASLVVTEKIESGGDKVLARVIDIRGVPPRSGDFITSQWSPYRAVPSNLLSAPRSTAGFGEIVRFEFDDQKFAAEGRFAYLIGKNLERGKNYPIYQKSIGRANKIRSFAKSTEGPTYRGQVYIVESTGGEAIGIIGETREGEVMIGDHLGIQTETDQ